MTELQEHRRRLEARVRPFEKAVHVFLTRMANQIVRPALEQYEADPDAIVKATRADRMEARELYMRFGLRQMADAARKTGGREVPYGELIRAVDERDLHLPSMKRWFTDTYRRADDLVVSTEQGVKQWIKEQVKNAHSQDPRPSFGEVARTIRAGINGPPGQAMGAISFGRAGVIARTELLIAENTGIYGGLEAITAEFVEWLAYLSPIFERRHDLMHKVRVKLGEFFELPSGVKLRYPGDPAAPVGEIANCRCGMRGIRRKK